MGATDSSKASSPAHAIGPPGSRPEKPKDPHLVDTRATAPKLTVEVNVRHLAAHSQCRALDLRDRSPLGGANHLVLVQQEHRHPGGVDQFLDLWSPGAQRGTGVPVGRGLLDAVRLVEDEDVEAVLLGVDELVVVLEHLLHARCPAAGDAAQGLGERRGARRVQDGATLTGELAQQAQGDHALARARTPGDDDDFLGVGAARRFDRAQHLRVRHLLFVQQREHLALLDFLGGECHQLLARPDRGAQQLVGGSRPALGRELGLQEVQELCRGPGR